MDVCLLGSGGWIPTSKRETCCALVREGPHALVIDAGTGIHRLVERRELLLGAETVHILLTHFHLDHVVGLSYLPALELPQAPVVWGPGKLLKSASTQAILERLLGPPLFSVALHAIAGEIVEIPKEQFEVGPFTLATRVQERHTEPTLAFRIGDSMTYCTDTAPDPGNIEFASGSQVLFHEAWHAQASSEDRIHTAAGDAGRIASAAGVQALVLIHINPLQESEQALAANAAEEFEAVEVGSDLALFQLR